MEATATMGLDPGGDWVHIAEYRDKEAEVERLRKEVIHWREARRSCIEAGDMMKAEIDRLRSTNYADLVYPPFGESFIMPTEKVDWQWIRDNCVVIRASTLAEKNAEIERLRGLLECVGNELGRENEGIVQMINEVLGYGGP
jgi:hypothetical protein